MTDFFRSLDAARERAGFAHTLGDGTEEYAAKAAPTADGEAAALSTETPLEAMVRAAKIAERDAWQNGLELVEMTQPEVDALLEYSTTLPTGKTLGKQWKRRLYVGPKRGAWLLCEYVEDPDPAYVAISAREIRIIPADQTECGGGR